jgi:MFS family permease
MTQKSFFGWKVVGAAFVVAAFGWGVGFYGPPVFLHALEAGRGWPVWVASAAVTGHFLVGAFMVTRLAGLHARFGVVRVTRAGAVAVALGLLGWGFCAEPWQLFLATLFSGAGWATTGAAAINAFVSPWFVRRRPVALGAAYNGASIGGVVFSPLWVALIAALGFGAAGAVVGLVMLVVLWWLSARYLGRRPAEMGLAPDGDALDAPRVAPPPVAALTERPWRERRFLTLAVGNALGLFAQIGLLAHLVALLAPAMGAQGAGFAAGLATAAALAGRTVAGWLLRPGVDRRAALAINGVVQAAGVALLASSGGVVWLALAGVALFGVGLGNATSLAPLVAQQEFAERDVPRVVGLLVASGQAAYAFAPLAMGLLRGMDPLALFAVVAACQVAGAVIVLSGPRLRPEPPPPPPRSA